MLNPDIAQVYKNWGHGGFHEKNEIIAQIGSGSFGTVYKARVKGTDRYRAVKTLDKSKTDMEDLGSEIESLLNLDHPHIIKFIRYYDEDTHFYLLFELCTGPDLFDAIVESMESSEGHMSEYDASVALRHMLKALKCVHGQFKGHYDIKPENFMYRSAERTNLKMIDLGSSSGFDLHSKVLKGTFEYMAPEVYKKTFGPEADIWSCGVVLFVMLTGSPFFPTQDAGEIAKLVSDRRWVLGRVKWAAEQGVSPEAVNLLKKMLKMDRHMRITVKEALKHPFIKNNQKPLHDSETISEAKGILSAFQDNLRKFSRLPMLARATLMLTAHLVANNEDNVPSRIAFRMMDGNGHGELSVDALEKAFEKFDVKISEDIDDLFSSVDVDGNGYISFMEFLSVTLPSSVFEKDASFAEAFNFFDRNGDGFIHAGDLVEAFGYETKEEKQLCHEAMRELGKDRLSRKDFLQMMRSSNVDLKASHSVWHKISKQFSTSWR